MFNVAKYISSEIRQSWNSTSYDTEDVFVYANGLMLNEARTGLKTLSFILFCLFGAEAFVLWQFGFSTEAAYTCGLLSLLAVHIHFSSRAAKDTRSIYVLGTTLLMVSGTAFVLLADKTGSFSLVLFSSVALLFMVVPVVPWGLREALMVLALIYIIFTVSSGVSTHRFEAKVLWSLQFIMLGAATISLTLVARNTRVRKNDIQARFELEKMNRKVLRLSNKDPLTGAWNRRFLANIFQEVTQSWHDQGKAYHFAFVDIDDFKPVNDGYGHEGGDQVLRCISKAFQEQLQDSGYLVRMGGDEFALLFTGEPESTISSGLEHLKEKISNHSELRSLDLTLSIGMMTVLPGLSSTQDSVYRRADAALYRAKDRKEYFSGEVNLVRHYASRSETGEEIEPTVSSGLNS